MMTPTSPASTATAWARFRFSVIGGLLSAPPRAERFKGAIQAALRALADKTWTHPVTGRAVQFAPVTIERWYYKARRAKDDPVAVLRRAVRKDCGKVSLPATLVDRLGAQHAGRVAPLVDGWRSS